MRPSACRLAAVPKLRISLSALVASLMLLVPAPGQAQVEVESDSVLVRRGLPAPPAVSPGGAFLRSLALPAWGHAAIGSGRGAFYTFAEAGSAWMLLRTSARLSSARDELALREASARATAVASGITDEAEIAAAVAEDEAVIDGVRRLDAREGQREDWVAALIFSVLISGVDAYVSAHLQDFPDPLSSSVRPSPWGGWEVAGTIRLPRGW